MGWSEDKFSEILSTDLDGRAALVLDLVEKHMETGEWLHLDLKEVPGQPTKDTQGDLAQEVSGFANEDGGLIVWGFEDLGKGGNPKPIQDAEQFKAWLDRMAPECTVPTVPDVRSVAVALSDGKGYAVTLVGRSDRGPHRAYMGPSKVKDHYFRRRSDRTERMSHGELDDMFGRRPRPCVVPEVILSRLYDSRLAWLIEFNLWNVGRATARWAALELTVQSGSDQVGFLDPLPGSEKFSRTAGTGEHGWPTGLFLPADESASVMHPGMHYGYARIDVQKAQVIRVPRRMILNWCVMAEGVCSQRGQIILLDRDLGPNGASNVLLARWEPHPDFGSPRHRVELGDADR